LPPVVVDLLLSVHCCLGGMNTAGLGGVGGPYRLDAGHSVYQVSDFDKSQVPQEVTTFSFTFSVQCVPEKNDIFHISVMA